MKFPDFFVIEITNRCNIKCPACPWHTCMKRNIKDMTFDEYVIIMKKILPYVKTVCLYLMGEPFLNKDLRNIVNYTKSLGKKVILSSNGMLIKQNLDWIQNSNIDYLQIALDGFTNESHEAYRIGSNFNTIMEGLNLLSKLKADGTLQTEIAIQTLVNKYNESELEQIKEFAENSGFTFHTKNMHYGRTKELYEKNSKLFRPTSKKNNRYIGQSFYSCSDYCPELDKAVILSNGNLVACCIDYDGITTWGNIFDDSFENIWQSEQRKKFLMTFATKKNFFCNECDMIYDLEY